MNKFMHLKMNFKVLTYLICILPAIGFSQWSDSPLENTIISDTTGSQILPHIETNSTGETYIAWFSEFGEGNFDLYLQKISKNGELLWGSSGLQISDHLSGTMVTDYDLKLDNEENVILVTQDMRTSASNVFAYKISPFGDFLWGDDGVQLSNTLNLDTSPKIAVGDNNNVVFVWPDVILGKSLKSSLYVKGVSPEGIIQWETVLADTAYAYIHPQIITWNEGDFLIAWVANTNTAVNNSRQNSWAHVFARKISPTGEPLWDSKIQIDSGQLIPFEESYVMPYLANDGNGGAYIMWQSNYPENVGGLPTTYVNKVYHDGGFWKPNGYSVSTLNNNSHSEARMEYLKNVDKLIVVWQEYHVNEDLISCSGIRGQLFNSEGNYLWADTGLVMIPLHCTMDTSFGHIFINESANNNVIVGYFEDYIPSASIESGQSTNIFVFSIDLEGNMIWSPSIVPISTATGMKSHPAISNLVSDQWVVVWEDNRENPDNHYEFGVYAQNISVDGEIGLLSIFEKPDKKTLNIEIFPNPVVNTLGINYILESTGSVQISIIDINGGLIKQYIEGEKSLGTYSKTIDASGLPPGMYVVKLQINNLNTYGKFIKN